MDFFRTWYGPTLKAFEALDDAGKAALEADLVEMTKGYDRLDDPDAIAVPAAYIEAVAITR